MNDFEDPDWQYPVNGTLVTVAGEYIEYYSLAEIINSETTLVSGQYSRIEPLILTHLCAAVADGEPLQNMYVWVESVEVTNSNPDSPTGGPNDSSNDYNDEFEVDGCL